MNLVVNGTPVEAPPGGSVLAVALKWCHSDNLRARHEPPFPRAASVATGNCAAAAGELLASLRRVGRDESLARITVTMLGDSLGMQRDSRMTGFTLKHAEGTDEFQAELTL